LPAAAILTGVAVGSTTEFLADPPRQRFLALTPALVFVTAFSLSVWRQNKFYFSLDPADAMQATYGPNPFSAAMSAAGYIRKNSPNNARIAVLGSEPEIYFYAHRRSATGYLYMYSLIMRQKYTARMQQELIHEVEAIRPEYLVYVDVVESWGERDRAPQASAFLSWLHEYTLTNYETDGVARLGDAAASDLWGEAARDHSLDSVPAIYVLKRKGSN
jgi:hypothetical protein